MADPVPTPPYFLNFLIPCKFCENLVNLYVGAHPEGWGPLLREILDPPLRVLLTVVRAIPDCTRIGQNHSARPLYAQGGNYSILV